MPDFKRFPSLSTLRSYKNKPEPGEAAVQHVPGRTPGTKLRKMPHALVRLHPKMRFFYEWSSKFLCPGEDSRTSVQAAGLSPSRDGGRTSPSPRRQPHRAPRGALPRAPPAPFPAPGTRRFRGRSGDGAPQLFPPAAGPPPGPSRQRASGQEAQPGRWAGGGRARPLLPAGPGCLPRPLPPLLSSSFSSSPRRLVVV